MAQPKRTEVFISYAREDRDRARTLASLLEARGYVAWWDWNLIGGADFRSEILAAIERAGKVVVLWSRHSVASSFVIDEAAHARDLGKLVPLVIDDVRPPFGFGNLHTLAAADLDREIGAIVAALEGRPATPVASAALPSYWMGRRGLLTGGLATIGAAAGGLAWWRSQDAGALVPSRSQANRIALVVGNDNYQYVPGLQNARRDAVRVTAALDLRGFRVIQALDGDRARLTELIQRFKTLLALGGVGLFYYAGHAAHIQGSDYIFPVDAFAEGTSLPFAPEAVIGSGIFIGDVTGPIENFFASRARTDPVRLAAVCIGINSACATTAGGPETMTDAAPPAPPLSPWAAPAPERGVAPPRPSIRDNGVVMMYSADEGEVALDGVFHDGGSSEHSPFATAFFTEIGEGSGELSGLARRIRRRVRTLTDGVQNPVLEDRSEVPFYFNRRISDPPEGVLRIVMLDSCRDNPFNRMR